MLLGFKVSNYRSFKEESSISFVASRLDEGYGFPTPIALDGSAVDALPVAAVLGANASGKSNLLKAMAFMRELVLDSATRSRRATRLGDPFLLDPASDTRPTSMELEFVIDGVRHLYGFELVNGKFRDEWLISFPHKRSQTLFDREDGTELTFGKALHGPNRVVAEITRPDVLFLSAAAQAGHPQLTKFWEFFDRNLILLDVAQRGEAGPEVLRRLAERHRRAVDLLGLADLGIIDAQVVHEDVAPAEREGYRKLFEEHLRGGSPREGPERDQLLDQLISEVASSAPSVQLVHRSSAAGVALPFSDESLGTRSWLTFVSFALDALDTGGSLLVDELDASLHPLLIAEALRIFQSPTSNPRNAQLIFSTHDVTLLGNSFERFKLSRGQVWLVEKNDIGASQLTPLSDYRPRKGEDLARGYLQGRYGGAPRVAARAASRYLSSAEPDPDSLASARVGGGAR